MRTDIHALVGLTVLLAITAMPLQAFAQQSRNVVLPEVDLHYEVFGEGFPILLLAGGPGASNKLMLRLVPEMCKTRGSLCCWTSGAPGNRTYK